MKFKHFNLDDATLFVKNVGKTIIHHVVDVDCLLITKNNELYIASIKKELKKDFNMAYMEHLHYYFDIEVISPKRSILENCCTNFSWLIIILFLLQ